jgi:hypothetical protein
MSPVGVQVLRARSTITEHGREVDATISARVKLGRFARRQQPASHHHPAPARAITPEPSTDARPALRARPHAPKTPTSCRPLDGPPTRRTSATRHDQPPPTIVDESAALGRSRRRTRLGRARPLCRAMDPVLAPRRLTPVATTATCRATYRHRRAPAAAGTVVVAVRSHHSRVSKTTHPATSVNRCQMLEDPADRALTVLVKRPGG